MRTSSLASVALALCAAFSVVAHLEDPGPSPTASIGCKAHGYRWECNGPRLDGTAIISPAAAETTHDAAHHDKDAPVSDSADLGPSPTVSNGCKSHGDHWNCNGPAPITVDLTTPAPSSAVGALSTGADNALPLDYRFLAAGSVLGVGVFLIGI